MNLPKWTKPIGWLQSISSNPLFEKIMLTNILKYESEDLIINKINPYFEKLQKTSSEEHILLIILIGLLIEVDIYISQGGRKNIKVARNKLKNAANLAEKLANVLREIKNYENDSLVFTFPDSLGELLQRQGYSSLGGIERAGDDCLDTEILLKNMAANLRNIKVGTPTLEWIDHHKSSSDFVNVITRALKRNIDPPNNIIGAFIFLCFGKEIDEGTIQKFNSPSRKKFYKTDIRSIKF